MNININSQVQGSDSNNEAVCDEFEAVWQEHEKRLDRLIRFRDIVCKDFDDTVVKVNLGILLTVLTYVVQLSKEVVFTSIWLFTCGLISIIISLIINLFGLYRSTQSADNAIAFENVDIYRRVKRDNDQRKLSRAFYKAKCDKYKKQQPYINVAPIVLTSIALILIALFISISINTTMKNNNLEKKQHNTQLGAMMNNSDEKKNTQKSIPKPIRESPTKPAPLHKSINDSVQRNPADLGPTKEDVRNENGPSQQGDKEKKK